MANPSKNFTIILDDESYTRLVELRKNLTKVEGLVKKLVGEDRQQWDDKNIAMDKNLTTTGNNSSYDWADNSISWDEVNNNQFDWYTTGAGEASNDKSNNQKAGSTGWSETDTKWINDDSKNEKSFDWDQPDMSVWESGWEKSEPKESNYENLDWNW